jgi:hypothetical protein
MSIYDLVFGFGWGLGLGITLAVGCFIVFVAALYAIYFSFWFIAKWAWLTEGLFGWWFESNKKIVSGATRRLQENTQKNKIEQKREVI